MAAVPLDRHRDGKPKRREKASSKAIRFGPAVETQLRSKASLAYLRSRPPMWGTESRILCMEIGIRASSRILTHKMGQFWPESRTLTAYQAGCASGRRPRRVAS